MILFLERTYTTLTHLKEALLSKEVRYIILDAYTAGANQHVFNDPLIRVAKLLKVDRTFGVVLSGDLGNVREEFVGFVKENDKLIMNILKNSTIDVQVMI